jgi:hypothetical protein
MRRVQRPPWPPQKQLAHAPPERNLCAWAVARRKRHAAGVERTSLPSTRVAGRGIVVATRLYLNGNAVRVVLGEVGLSVLTPDDLAPNRVLSNDVLHVGSIGLLGLDGQGGARDEVAL